MLFDMPAAVRGKVTVPWGGPQFEGLPLSRRLEFAHIYVIAQHLVQGDFYDPEEEKAARDAKSDQRCEESGQVEEIGVSSLGDDTVIPGFESAELAAVVTRFCEQVVEEEDGVEDMPGLLHVTGGDVKCYDGPIHVPIEDLHDEDVTPPELVEMYNRRAHKQFCVIVPSSDETTTRAVWLSWARVVAASISGSYATGGYFVKPVGWCDGAAILHFVQMRELSGLGFSAVTRSVVGADYTGMLASGPHWSPLFMEGVPADNREIGTQDSGREALSIEVGKIVRDSLYAFGDAFGADASSHTVAMLPDLCVSPNVPGLCYLHLFERDSWPVAVLRFGFYPNGAALDLTEGVAVGKVVHVSRMESVVHVAIQPHVASVPMIVGSDALDADGKYVGVPSRSRNLTKVMGSIVANKASWVRGDVETYLVALGRGVEMLKQSGWRVLATKGLSRQLHNLTLEECGVAPPKYEVVLKKVVLGIDAAVRNALHVQTDYIATSMPLSLLRIGSPGDCGDGDYASGPDDDSWDDLGISDYEDD